MHEHQEAQPPFDQHIGLRGEPIIEAVHYAVKFGDLQTKLLHDAHHQATEECIGGGECILPKPVLQCIAVGSHLYQKRNLINVIAVTQGYCEPVLQSRPEQWGVLLP